MKFATSLFDVGASLCDELDNVLRGYDRSGCRRRNTAFHRGSNRCLHEDHSEVTSEATDEYDGDDYAQISALHGAPHDSMDDA